MHTVLHSPALPETWCHRSVIALVFRAGLFSALPLVWHLCLHKTNVNHVLKYSYGFRSVNYYMNSCQKYPEMLSNVQTTTFDKVPETLEIIQLPSGNLGGNHRVVIFN